MEGDDQAYRQMNLPAGGEGFINKLPVEMVR
jgi:hypothetical protein